MDRYRTIVCILTAILSSGSLWAQARPTPMAPFSNSAAGTRGLGTCEATIIVGNGQGESGSTGNPVPVASTNTQPLRGLTMSIADGSADLTVSGCNSLLQAFTCDVFDSGDAASVIYLSLSAATIPVGSNQPIFELLYDVSAGAASAEVTLLPQDLLVSDESNAPCAPSGVAGSFLVLGGCQTDLDCDDGSNCTLDSCDVASGTCSSIVQSVGVCGPGIVDFGPAGTSPQEGYERDGGSAFEPGGTSGWLIPSFAQLQSRDRACAGVEASRSTFVFSGAERVWELEVVNGDYDVAVSVGDCVNAQGPQRMDIEGEPFVENEILAANEFVERTRTVRVLDGRLSVAVGGAGGFTLLNALDVSPAAEQAAFRRSINFQTETAPSPRGFEADGGDAYDPKRGRGWSRDRRSFARARLANADRALDTLIFAGAQPAVFEADVPPGSYEVKLSVGDAGNAQGPHRVIVEGLTVLDGEMTARNAFADRTTRCTVVDGRLTVEIGGLAGFTTLNYVTLASAPVTGLNVNFQPPGSVVPPGYTADSGERFGPQRGFGWLDRDLTAMTRERGVAEDPRLDTLLFVGAQLATWEAELPCADYQVAVSVGDAAFSQGPHQVTVEDVALFTGELTGPNAFLSDSARVRVCDGRLTLEVGAGVSGFTTINSIDVEALSGYAVNFQPELVQVPSGFVPDSGRGFSPERGYGWTDDFLFNADRTRVRGQVAEPSLDTFIFTSSPPETWRIDVLDGDYRVTVAVGDAAFNQGPHHVRAQNVPLVDGAITVGGSFLTRSVCVTVDDGTLVLEMGTLAASGFTTLDYVLIEPSDCSTGDAIRETILEPRRLEEPAAFGQQGELGR